MNQYQEKQSKLLKTVKAARGRIQELNAERDRVHESSVAQCRDLVHVTLLLYVCRPSNF